MATSTGKKPRPYRLDVRLPRRVSERVEKLRLLLEKESGKRVTKSDVVLNVLERFFETLPE